MKIELHTGCTTWALIVDDERIETREQELALVDKLIPLIRGRAMTGDIPVQRLVELFPPDDYESDERCEQCGDTPSTTTWNL